MSKQTIDYLSSQITQIESIVLAKTKLQKSYEKLLTIPGVGKILSLTIILETGSISRFQKVGNYASYARKVPADWKSNNKRKGKGNTKNGNKYLAWAFSEAAEFARRFDDDVKTFFNKKSSKTSASIAYSALGHKLARAAYYIMRDNVEFDSKKLFT